VYICNYLDHNYFKGLIILSIIFVRILLVIFSKNVLNKYCVRFINLIVLIIVKLNICMF